MSTQLLGAVDQCCVELLPFEGRASPKVPDAAPKGPPTRYAEIGRRGQRADLWRGVRSSG
jgi:hypothetical protein